MDVTVSPGAALGARTVILTTGTEVAQLVGGFTVTPGLPTLFSINPVSAIQGVSLTVILNGAFTNFTPQLTTAFFGAGISVGTVTVNGPDARVGADHDLDRRRRRPAQRHRDDRQ